MEVAVIAANIKATAAEKGVSLTKMFAKLDIRQGLIYDLEKLGKWPSAKILFLIADYLDCSVDYLLGRTDRPEVNK